MPTIIRRRKLGYTSVKEICNVSTTGIKWARSDKVLPKDDTYIRWGCTATLPENVTTVINPAKAIHRVNDKRGFRELLDEHELCPKTWFNVWEAVYTDPEIGKDYLREKQLIVRKSKHAQGKDLDVVNSITDLLAACSKYGSGNFYISDVIDKVAEYRVFVVQGRAVAVARKTPSNPDDIAWNVAKGGKFENVRWSEWPLKAVKQSIQAFKLSGLDFGGVDVMLDAEGNSYILEINSAPSLTSPYRQQCMAKALDYMVEKGKDTIELIPELGGYTKFIHPAVCDKAKMV